MATPIKYDKIKGMKLFIKKWWLLENLRKEMAIYSGKQTMEAISQARLVFLPHQIFIVGKKDSPEHIGLAEKFFWWKCKYSSDKLKRRITEYYNILHICEEEGYIVQAKTIDKDGKEVLQYSPITSKAYHISGFGGLINGLLEEYDKWTAFLLGGGGVALVWILTHILHIF